MAAMTVPQKDTEIMAVAAGVITEILGPTEHPDVQAVLDTISRALAAQRRLIVRRITVEARQGIYGAPKGQRTDYAGGLRRAARIARGGAR